MMEQWSSSLDFRALATKYGTPLYLFHPAQLKENAAQFLRLVHKPENIAFPVKACPAAPVLRMMADMGLSADCAAASEISIALDAGFPCQRIFYNSPVICEVTAKDVLASGGVVVLNDTGLLDHYVGPDVYSAGRIYLRWNPDVPVDSSETGNSMVAHGRGDSQFGSSSQAILALPPAQLQCVTGLHTHIGSRVTSPTPFADAVKTLHVLLDKIFLLTGHHIAELNLGGGLKSPMNNQDVCSSISEMTATLNKIVRQDIRYIVEPGNALVGNTMGLLATVKSFKTKGAGRYAILDVGSNQLLKNTFAGIPLSILRADAIRMPVDGADAVVGPLCFAGDILLPQTCLTGVETGDPVFIQHCGAYCLALSHHFNGLARPAMLTVENNGECCISQAAEDLWLTSPASAGLRWNYDKFADDEQQDIAVTGAVGMPVDILSATMTGRHTLSVHLKCQKSLNVLERTALFFSLSDVLIRYLYQNAVTGEPDAVVLLPGQGKRFKAGMDMILYFTAGDETREGISVSFGRKDNLFGFCRINICSRMESL